MPDYSSLAQFMHSGKCRNVCRDVKQTALVAHVWWNLRLGSGAGCMHSGNFEHSCGNVLSCAVVRQASTRGKYSISMQKRCARAACKHSDIVASMW